MRPPLADTFKKFFKDRGVEGRSPAYDMRQGLIGNHFVFRVQDMTEYDARACQEARAARFVKAVTDSKTWCGKAWGYKKEFQCYGSDREYPEFMLHGTDVKAGCDILCDGFMNPGPGPAGIGVYFYEFPNNLSSQQ